MKIAFTVAFIAIMLLPVGTTWLIALNSAPKRIAFMQAVACLTIEMLTLIAIHVAFYMSRTWTIRDIIGFVLMYVFGCGFLVVLPVIEALSYINKYHDELEPPKAPKLTRFKSDLR